MDFEKVFKKENLELLFRTGEQKGSFIAEACDCFSGYMTRDQFSRSWAWEFPTGRYVITVYRRVSVFQEGKLIWKNEEDLSEKGKDSRYRAPSFVIALERETEYQVPGWKRPLHSHILRSTADPLHCQIYSSPEKAGKTAKEYSEQGIRAAVLKWFEDYDMY